VLECDRQPEKNVRLDRDKALTTALQLLGEQGIEKLTMRSLGAALDVQAPSLYYYFPSKRVLIDAMADAILAPVVNKLNAKQSDAILVEDIAHAYRRALLAYRDGALVISGSYGATPNVLKITDILLGTFMRDGLPPERAVDATFNLTYFIQGFVLEEQAFIQSYGRDRKAAERKKAASEFEKTLTAELPHLRQCLPLILASDFDVRFQFGLDTQLNGLHVRLA